MPANGWSRRRWAAALLGSLIAHVLVLGIVHFGAVPASNADEDIAPIAILRITRGVIVRSPAARSAETRAQTEPRRRGHRPAAPQTRPAAARAAGPAARAVATLPEPGSPATAAPGAAPDTTSTQQGPPGTPGPQPSLSPEQLAALNVRIHEALPSAMPATMKQYATDLASLAIHGVRHGLTAATYPLPTGGIFAHALIVRVGDEAVAVRAVKRLGRGYLCIGYLAVVDERGVDASIAGPYIGPCKRAWLPQLGLATPEPSPSPSASPSPSPSP